MTDHLGRLLLVTLEAARVNANLPVLGALRSWLDSWRGIGGMAHQGYDIQLTRYESAAGGRRSIRPRMEHSPTSATGSAWERTPWRAVQSATRDALRRADG